MRVGVEIINKKGRRNQELDSQKLVILVKYKQKIKYEKYEK